MKKLIIITPVISLAFSFNLALAQSTGNNAPKQKQDKNKTMAKQSPANTSSTKSPHSGDAASAEAGSLSINKGMKHPSADPYSRNNKKGKSAKAPSKNNTNNNMGSITGNPTGTATTNGTGTTGIKPKPSGKKKNP